MQPENKQHFRSYVTTFRVTEWGLLRMAKINKDCKQRTWKNFFFKLHKPWHSSFEGVLSVTPTLTQAVTPTVTLINDTKNVPEN